MKIKVTQTIDVPRDFYCGNCLRKEQDKKGQKSRVGERVGEGEKE